MNAMYPNMTVVNSTTTTNAKTEGKYDWETGTVNAVPSTVCNQLRKLNEEMEIQENMIRAIGENLHGKLPEKEAMPKQAPVCVLEALEDLGGRMCENSFALKTIINDLGFKD